MKIESGRKWFYICEHRNMYYETWNRLFLQFKKEIKIFEINFQQIYPSPIWKDWDLGVLYVLVPLNWELRLHRYEG